jgi:hypothetical protein
MIEWSLGPSVAGLRRREQGAAVAGIEHEVVHDVAEKVRPLDPLGPPGRVAAEQPGAFSGGDEHDDARHTDPPRGKTRPPTLDRTMCLVHSFYLNNGTDSRA